MPPSSVVNSYTSGALHFRRLDFVRRRKPDSFRVTSAARRHRLAARLRTFPKGLLSISSSVFVGRSCTLFRAFPSRSSEKLPCFSTMQPTKVSLHLAKPPGQTLRPPSCSVPQTSHIRAIMMQVLSALGDARVS